MTLAVANVFKLLIIKLEEFHYMCRMTSKYNVEVFSGENALVNKVISATSLDSAVYADSIISELKKALNVQILNHSYSPVCVNQASATYILLNPKTGKRMFILEVKVLS